MTLHQFTEENEGELQGKTPRINMRNVLWDNECKNGQIPVIVQHNNDKRIDTK